METEASQEVTDEMLSRAADEPEEVVEEVIEEAVEETEIEDVVEEETDVVTEEELPEEPEDNSARSQLGRKVKSLETLLEEERKARAEESARLNETLEKLSGYLAPKEEEEEFVFPETREELDALLDKRLEERESKKQSQQEEVQTRYQKEYIDALQEILEDDPDRDSVLEIFDDYNYKHSENGYKDAAKNIIKAKDALKSGKKIPLKSEKAKAPLGGGGKEAMPTKKKTMPKLDPEAAAYAKSQGFTDEEIIEVFG